jgi:integrase/recombinase XerD
LENNTLIPHDQNTIMKSLARPEEVPENTPPEDWTFVREWLRSKKSPHTRRTYKRDIKAFYAYIGSMPLVTVDLTQLQDYADHVKRAHPEPATQAQMLAAVKSLMTFGQKTGKLQFNVGAALQLPQGKEKLAERILEPSQLHRMIYEAEKSGNTRNYTLVLLLYGSGIRCAELCNLQWRDVQANRKGGQITVLGKRNKTRSIPLHPAVWKALKNYRPAHARPDDYVFQSRQISLRNDRPSRRLTETRVWQIVAGIAEKAGIEDVSPHWLRHTHATRALEGHAPIKLLQETLGHSSLAVTGRYTHVRPEDSSSMYLDL